MVIYVKNDCPKTLKDLEDVLDGNVIAIYMEGAWIPLPNLNTPLKDGMKVLVKVFNDKEKEEYEEAVRELGCKVEFR